VLETVLSIFERATASGLPIHVIQRTGRADGSTACLSRSCRLYLSDLDLSIDAEIAEALRLVMVSEVAVRFGAAASNSLPGVLAKRFGVQSPNVYRCSSEDRKTVHLRLGPMHGAAYLD